MEFGAAGNANDKGIRGFFKKAGRGCIDNHPVSCSQLARYFHLDGKQLQQQYKDHIGDYKDWDQREHASEWLLYSQNIGPYLSIDETSLSNGELYTIVSNQAAKGRKGSLLAMVKGTEAASVIEILRKISRRVRSKVREVTLDMAANMGGRRAE